MIIGIDASRFNAAKRTGIEHYSDEIITGLVNKAKKQKTHVLRLYAKKETQFPEDFNHTQIEIVRVRGKRLWTQIRLSAKLMRSKPDSLFIPSHAFPLVTAKKNYITIHDVAFAKYPEVYSTTQRLYLHYITNIACKLADTIIVPSKATKEDLVHYFNGDPKKIVVIHHGLSRDHLKIQEKTPSETKKMVFIGRIESKKNLIRLLKAFNNFLKSHPEWKLILAGSKGQGAESVIDTISELALENTVHVPGYVNEEEKAQILSNADMFVFPSLTEGFGLPILEAFHYEIPTLTSEGTSTEEIGGNAALYCNPLDITSIQSGMEKLAANSVLCNELKKKMRARIKKFNWEDAVQKTWEIITQ